MAQPRRYQTYEIQLTKAHRDHMAGVTGDGGYQSVCRRIAESAKSFFNGEFVARIAETDLEHLKDWARRSDDGGWQELARGVLAHNEIEW